MKAPNGARVVCNSQGGGVVHLGWGRGRIVFSKNEETGELEWSDPNNCPDPDVQDIDREDKKGLLDKKIDQLSSEHSLHADDDRDDIKVKIAEQRFEESFQ